MGNRYRAAAGNRLVRTRHLLYIAASQDPGTAQSRQALLHLSIKFRISPGPRAVVQGNRFIYLCAVVRVTRRAELDLAERHPDVWMNPATDIYARGVRQRFAALWFEGAFGCDHKYVCRSSVNPIREEDEMQSLRQHYLEQVQRVCFETIRSTLSLRAGCFGRRPVGSPVTIQTLGSWTDMVKTETCSNDARSEALETESIEPENEQLRCFRRHGSCVLASLNA